MVKIRSDTGEEVLIENDKVPSETPYEDNINGYKIYLIKNNYEKNWHINLIFIKYRPRSFGYVFVKQTEE